MLADTDQIKKDTFRSLVIALFASFVYDMLWFVTDFSSDADGSNEASIRSFTYWVAFISTLFRVSKV